MNKNILKYFGLAALIAFAGAGAVQAEEATVTVNGTPCETLRAAFEAVKNIAGEITIAISAGTINTGNMDGFGNVANKKVTIKGAGMDATELLWTWPSGAGIGCLGAEVTFEDLALTINHQGYGMPYTQGLEHPKSQLYKNVKINGSITTMDDVTFEGCLFTGMLKDANGNNVDAESGKYSIWVYGGGVNFVDCTFKKTKNASIKLYGEKSNGIACCISGTTFESAGSKGSAIYASNENNIDKPIYEIYIDAGTKVEDGTTLILPSGNGLSVINPAKDEDGKITSGTFITKNTDSTAVKDAISKAVAEGVEVPELVNGQVVIEGREEPSAVAKIGTAEYATLQEAFAAANDGDTVTLLADLADIGTVSLKGITFDGNGKKITGESALYLGAAKTTTIKSVVFENIHNDSPVGAEDCARYGFPEGAVGTQSAIYAEGFSTGSITITGCTFDSVDWDAIQIVPVDTATGTIAITDNVFKHTDESKRQLRYVHIQCTDHYMPTIKVTATDNQMFDCEDGVGAFSVAGYGKGSGSVYSGNYISDASKIDCAASYDIKVGDFYPMRSQPTVDVDDIDKVAIFDNKPIFSGDELVEAINACTTAKPDLYFYGNLVATSAVVLENPKITKLYWYGASKSGVPGFLFRAPSLALNIPAYMAYNAKVTVDGAFVAGGECTINNGSYSAESFSGNFVLKGGTYDKDVSGLVDPHVSRVASNGDGTWTVSAHTDATAVEDGRPFAAGPAYFCETLQEAINSGKSTDFRAYGEVKEDIDCGSGTVQITLYNQVPYSGSLTGQNTITVLPGTAYATPQPINFTSVNCTTFKLGGGNKAMCDVTIGGGEIEHLEIQSTRVSTILSGDTTIDEIALNTYYYYNSPRVKASLTITGGTYGTIKCHNGGAAENSLPDEALDLVITGGTFGFNPNGYVDENTYEIVDNKGGTWTVRVKVEPETKVVVPDESEIKPVDEEGKEIAGDDATKAVEAAKTAVEAIAGNTGAEMTEGTGVEAAVFTSGEEVKAEVAQGLNDQAKNVTKDDKGVELSQPEQQEVQEKVAAVSTSKDLSSYVKVDVKSPVVEVKESVATVKKLVYDVQPMAVTKVTTTVDSANPKTVTVEAPVEYNDAAKPITFRLPLTDAFTVSAIVTHEGDPDRLCMVQGAAGGRYVEVTASHFSLFTATPSEIIETTTESKTVLGIKRVDYTVTQTTADLAAAVPWLMAAEENMPVSGLITTGLSQGDQIQVYEKSANAYYTWLYRDGEWEGAPGTGTPSADKYKLERGRAFWYKPFGVKGASGTYTQVGLYSEASITSKVDSASVASASFANPVHFLMASPKYEDFNLKEKLTAAAGCEDDDVVVIVATGARYRFNGTVWGQDKVVEKKSRFDDTTYKTTEFEAATGNIVVPAGTAFWYLSAHGAPEFEW